MTDIRPLAPDFAVAPQIAPEDVPALAAAGYTLIVNNRPDGEAPGQPKSAEIEAAARAAGLAYVHAPFVGAPPPEAIAAVEAARANTQGPVLAFCRSGTRSAGLWGLSEVRSGRRAKADVIHATGAQGYDLRGLMATE